MIVRTVEELTLRLSPIIHILLTQDFGPISKFMDRYIDFLRNYVDNPKRSQEIENEMLMLYIGIYEYLSEDVDRSIALLHHLQEEHISFFSGEVPIGKIEIQYEEESVQ